MMILSIGTYSVYEDKNIFVKRHSLFAFCSELFRIYSAEAKTKCAYAILPTMLNVTELRSGTYFQEDGVPYEVLKYDHIKMGRGTATVRIKAKNLFTTAIVTKTFISGKRVEEAELEERRAIFKYRTSADYVFADEDDEEIEVSREIVGENSPFLKKGLAVNILSYQDRLLTLRLPIKVTYRVKEAPPDARGNSATVSYKEVILENQLKIKAPMFIKEGDDLVVDTRTGEYISRN